MIIDGFLFFFSWWFLINRDNFLILQTIIASMTYYMFPFLQNLPSWNINGLFVALMLHVGISEPLYYWVHRKLHGDYLFTNYHSLHHSSLVPQPLTGENYKYWNTYLSYKQDIKLRLQRYHNYWCCRKLWTNMTNVATIAVTEIPKNLT